MRLWYSGTSLRTAHRHVQKTVIVLSCVCEEKLQNVIYQLGQFRPSACNDSLNVFSQNLAWKEFFFFLVKAA